MSTHDRPTNGGKPIIRRTDRAGQACIACAAAKARCGDEKPCRRCQAKGISCETQSSSQNTQHTQTQLSPSGTASISRFHVAHLASSIGTSSGTNASAQSGQLDSLSFPQSSNPYEVESAQPNLDSGFSLAGSQTYGVEPLDGNIPNPNLDFMTEEMLFLSNTADFNNQNLDFGFLDFNFDEVHLDIANCPKEGTGSDQKTVTRPQRRVSRSIPRDASRAHAAFIRSPWLWTPAQKDRILVDQDK